LNIFKDKVKADENGNLPYSGVMSHVLSLPSHQRSQFVVNSLIPFCKTQPFFKDRGLNDAAIAEVLSLMSYKEVKQD